MTTVSHSVIRQVFSAWLILFMSMASMQAQTSNSVQQTNFGEVDGCPVELITLRNNQGTTAEIISYGAIIKALRIADRKGNFTNVVLSTDTLQNFQRFGGAAAVIGRVANRIKGAAFELDGQTYKLTANERKNTIHGGRKGFARAVWKVESTSRTDHASSVRLSYASKDGEEGFPGNLKVMVTYTLGDNNEFRIDYEAATDKPTIVNLTNHAYWNLGGSGSCLDHRLQIFSQQYTPCDAELIPTGEIRPVKGSPLDFSEPVRIGERLDELAPGFTGYDHNYVLSSSGELKLAARLEEPKSGRIMEVRTTQPALQLYTGNHLKHAGVCLETQHYPDAIHHSNFPSIVLRPGRHFAETTVFTFLTQ